MRDNLLKLTGLSMCGINTGVQDWDVLGSFIKQLGTIDL